MWDEEFDWVLCFLQVRGACFYEKEAKIYFGTFRLVRRGG